MSQHIPVLLSETLNYLITDRSGIYFDGTIGFGGHASEIINNLNFDARYLGTDKDISALDFCKKKFEADERVRLFNASFSDIDKISKIEFIEGYDGIFADLGVSSFQLDSADEGFTFREDVPLDLRMNKNAGVPASGIINSLPEDQLADIFYQFGEEKKSRVIARKIAEHRKAEKIITSGQLKNIIAKIVPERFLNKTLSRVFQALRIYVNDELGDLSSFLEKSIALLKPGGRIVILSYHSLEDRIVKDKFKYESLRCICPPEIPVCVCGKKQTLKILTSKPVVPSDKEVADNRRSRSAKLRAAQKV